MMRLSFSLFSASPNRGNTHGASLCFDFPTMPEQASYSTACKALSHDTADPGDTRHEGFSAEGSWPRGRGNAPCYVETLSEQLDSPAGYQPYRHFCDGLARHHVTGDLALIPLPCDVRIQIPKRSSDPISECIHGNWPQRISYLVLLLFRKSTSVFKRYDKNYLFVDAPAVDPEERRVADLFADREA